MKEIKKNISIAKAEMDKMKWSTKKYFERIVNLVFN